MPTTRPRRRPLFLKVFTALAAAGLFLLGYQWGNQHRYGQAEAPTISGVLIRPAQPLPDFTLTGPAGTVTPAELRHRWSLIALVSPATPSGHRAAARMIEIANRLAERPGLRADLGLLLISTDDAPRLARDFQRLTPDLQVLTAERTTLSALRQGLGASEHGTGEADAGPPMLFLIGPAVELLALFPGALEPAVIADDLKALASRSAEDDGMRGHD